jgi:hypothetical protein
MKDLRQDTSLIPQPLLSPEKGEQGSQTPLPFKGGDTSLIPQPLLSPEKGEKGSAPL